MIIKGSSRAGAAGLSKHLQNTDTNERVTFQETSWTLAKDIGGVLHEMDAVAAGGRCKAFLYHAQINPKADEHLSPEQWQKAVDTLEKNLWLEGHQRVVVEHVKDGRQHYHIVWNRLDVETLKAVSMSWNYRTHELTARQLEKEFGLERVQGVHVEREEGKSRGVDTPERWEFEHGQKSGLDPRQIKAELSELWRASKTGSEFATALEERGYILAKGDRRDFCIIDSAGDFHSLARRVEGVKAAEVRGRMQDVDRAALPTVAQAQEMQHERQLKMEQQREQEKVQRSNSLSKVAQLFRAQQLKMEQEKAQQVKREQEEKAKQLERAEDLKKRQVKQAAEVRERVKEVAPVALPTVAQDQKVRHERQQKREQEKTQEFKSAEDFKKHQTADKLEQIVESIKNESEAVFKASSLPSLGKAAHVADRTLNVSLGVAGKAADTLVNVVCGLLDAFTGGASHPTTAQERIHSAEARRAYYAAKAAEAKRDQALNHISADIKNERNIALADVSRLNRDDLLTIKASGDAGLIEIIERHAEREKEKARELLEYSRER